MARQSITKLPSKVKAGRQASRAIGSGGRTRFSKLGDRRVSYLGGTTGIPNGSARRRSWAAPDLRRAIRTIIVDNKGPATRFGKGGRASGELERVVALRADIDPGHGDPLLFRNRSRYVIVPTVMSIGNGQFLVVDQMFDQPIGPSSIPVSKNVDDAMAFRKGLIMMPEISMGEPSSRWRCVSHRGRWPGHSMGMEPTAAGAVAAVRLRAAAWPGAWAFTRQAPGSTTLRPPRHARSTPIRG